jgi:hypothetical protein
MTTITTRYSVGDGARRRALRSGRTAIPAGLRYKALGNSMAVNCMRWIGRRIAMVEGITTEIRSPT